VGEQVFDAPGHGKAGWSSVLGALQDWPKPTRVAAFGSASPREGKAKGTPFAGEALAPVLYPGNIYCACAANSPTTCEMAAGEGKEPAHDEGLGEKPWHSEDFESSVVGRREGEARVLAEGRLGGRVTASSAGPPGRLGRKRRSLPSPGTTPRPVGARP